MAQITLVFNPDFSKVQSGIEKLKTELGNITVSQSGAKAAEGLAAGLQKAASSAAVFDQKLVEVRARADELTKQYGTLTRLVGTEFTENQDKATKAIATFTNRIGQTSQFLIDLEEAEAKLIRTTDDYDKAERAAKQDQARLEKQLLKEYEQAQKEKADYKKRLDKEMREAEAEQHRKRIEEIRFEAEAAKEARKEEEKAEKSRESAVDKANRLRASYAKLLETLESIRNDYPEGTFDRIASAAKIQADELYSLNQEAGDYAEKVDNIAKLHTRLQAVFAETRQVSQWQKENKAAADEAVKLTTAYDNLIIKIQKLKAQYPEGTFDALEQQVKEARDALTGLDSTTRGYADGVRASKSALDGYNRDLTEIQANTEKVKEATEGTGFSLQNLFRWFVGGRVLSKLTSEIREALQTMKDVDTALVTVQKTTGYSKDQIDDLTESAYSLASAYGRTASEILNAASVYARAGFKDNLEDMTELSALLQNVGDLEGDVAAKFLVATNAAWKLNGSYDDLLRVIDGLNMQTNQAAVDMESLTSGITVAGSVFAGAGESVQTFAGLLGAGVATTQRSGAEIARGLRTILMNVRQIKGELEDGEIIDETTISDAAAALHSVGISVADANGELRLTSDVLSDLAGKWSGLTTAEQSYLSQSLAGKRQANVLAAIMQNWEEAQRQMTLYANGAGSAMQENEIYLNSWEAKTKQLSAAWTEFVSHLIDTGTIKRALDAIIRLVDILDTDLGRAALKVTALSVVFGKLAGGVAGTVKSFTDIASLVTSLSSSLSAAAFSVGGITSIIVGATAATIGMYNALTTTEEEYEQAAKESASAYTAAKTEYDNLIAKSGELTESEKSRLEVLRQQLSVLQRQANPNNYQAYLSKYDPTDPAKNAAEVATQLQRDYNYQLQMARDPANGLQRNVWIANAEETKQKVYEMRDELQKYLDVLGSDFPKSGKYALNTLNDLINGWEAEEKQNRSDTEAWLEAGRAAFAWMQQAQNVESETVSLRDKLEAISQTATAYDTAIGGVVEALNNFGDGSVEVYDAMKALETAIPGSTDKIYDFDTAALTTKEDIFGSKEALLDFIDATKQLEFSSQIEELEKLAVSYWDVAGAALAAMNAQAANQMAGVLSFTTGGTAQPSDIVTQISDIKAQKAEWDAYIAALRTRKDYRPTGGGSGGGSSGTSSGTATDYELERLKAIVSLEKAELSFLQASGKSLDEINAKRKEIQAALHEEAEYLRAQLEVLKAQEVAEEDKAEHEAKVKALEQEILGLSTEWWSIQKSINDDLEKAEEERIKQLEEEQKLLEEQKKLQQEMFDTLKKTVDEYYAKLISDKEEELTLEEKILAVQKAEDDLAKAQRQRTVRYYNASTGQWEWAANQKTVKAAEDALKKAQEELSKYQREQAWKEFKKAWEYVAKQIKDGAMTFQEAYDYMYKSMKKIQDKYGVDLSTTLEDSIGGFKDLNYGIDGLTQEVATLLGASVGVLGERLKEYETAVGALKAAFDDAAEKVKGGKMSMEEAYSYLRDRAREIADKYGIDMTKALDDAIEGMDKTNMSIDELWKSVIINLMKVNSARWFDATDEEKALLHAQNEYLAKLIGATYDPTGYWYLDGTQLYGSQKGVSYETEGYGSRTGSGGGYGVGTETTVGGGGGTTGTSGTTTGYVGGGSTGGGAAAEIEEMPAIPEVPAIPETVAEETGEAPPVSGYGEWDLWQHGPLSKLYTGETDPKDGYLHGYFKGSDGTVYSYDTAPDEVLWRFGMYRDPATGGVSIAPGAIPPELAGTTPYTTTGSLKEYMERVKYFHHDPEGKKAYRKAVEEGETKRRQLLASRGGSDDDMLSLGESDRGMTTGSDGLGGVTAASYISGGTVNQYYGNTYNFGDVTMDETKARNTTVYELAELSRTLGKYNGR